MINGPRPVCEANPLDTSFSAEWYGGKNLRQVSEKYQTYSK